MGFIKGLSFKVDQLKFGVDVVGGVVDQLQVAIGAGIEDVESRCLCGGEGRGWSSVRDGWYSVIGVGCYGSGDGRVCRRSFGEWVFDILLGAGLLREFQVQIIRTVWNNDA